MHYNFNDIDPHSLGMARVGEKVRYLDRNGYEAERENARNHMESGDILTVESVSIGGWSSSYRFQETGERWFNTVMFEPMAASDSPASPQHPETTSKPDPSPKH